MPSDFHLRAWNHLCLGEVVVILPAWKMDSDDIVIESALMVYSWICILLLVLDFQGKFDFEYDVIIHAFMTGERNCFIFTTDTE